MFDTHASTLTSTWGSTPADTCVSTLPVKPPERKASCSSSSASDAGDLSRELERRGAWGGELLVYAGERYDSMEAFLSAVTASRASLPLPEELTAGALAARVRGLYHEYAGAERGRLGAPQFRGLAASVAAELGMDPRRFGDLSATFDRFDVNGDGSLDEDECVMLAESMLRHYLHDARPSGSRPHKMLQIESKHLEVHYHLTKKLGQGGQGVVYLAVENSTGLPRVVKCYDKGNASGPLEEIKSEFNLLRSLDHPRIQRLYDIFEDRHNVYIVSEPYYGGHLGDLIENAFEAGVHVVSSYLAKVLHKVLQGAAYLHSRYIVHCDLKESNVMIASRDGWDEPTPVVIDFGLAHNFATRGTRGGTPGYMPPEVWTRGLWTPKGDVHSLGVVTYQIFSNGERCFNAAGDDAMKNATLTKLPSMDYITGYWRRCSDLPPLVSSMLAKDPRARPTVRQCMEHPFFAKRVLPKQDDDDEAEERIPLEVVEKLGALGHRTKLQRAILTDIATTHNLAELRELNSAFAAMDADSDGVVTADEARAALRSSMEGDSLEQAVERLVGTDGQVGYTAFMAHLLAAKSADENRLLWREFQQLDRDGSGHLRRGDVAQLLERPALAEVLHGRSAAQMMRVMDEDGDGRVVFEEFRKALGQSSR